MQGLLEEAAGVVLLQSRCSAQGRCVFQLHPDALVLSCLPYDTTKHTLIPCHTDCIAASMNKGREIQRADDPITE